MSLVEPLRFDAALKVAAELVAARLPGLATDAVLVRDLYGRFRLALASTPSSGEAQERLGQLAHDLAAALGAFAYRAEDILLYREDLFSPDAIFTSPDRRLLVVVDGQSLSLLDRQVIGQDWSRGFLQPLSAPAIPRLTFYGVKGGVGRSTGLAALAWRLAREGRQVLVLDLDLESPGVGTTLLPPTHAPEYGVVDWFVEDAVGQANDGLLSRMAATSPIGMGLSGDVRVVPAFGTSTAEYLPKLARAYVEVAGPTGAQGFADRLGSFLQALGSQERPDIMLLDSRAGLHDIAAVTATRLGADVLLFAIDSPQTWSAYRQLFLAWRSHPQFREFRDRVKMVAAMVPETGAQEYLASFRQRSYDLFTENLYEAAEPEDMDAFNFDLHAVDAPHYPLRINWHRAMQEFDPHSRPEVLSGAVFDATFGEFCDEVQARVLPVDRP